MISACKVALLAALSMGTAAAAPDLKNVTLAVESKNSTLHGQNLVGIHFGAGINGVILTKDNVSAYSWNTSSDEVGESVNTSGGPSEYTFREVGGDLTIGVAGNPVYLKSDYLTVNGSSSVFYACRSLPYDPYNYLQKGGYGVAIYASGAPSDCQPIKITSKKVSNSSVGNATAVNGTDKKNSTASHSNGCSKISGNSVAAAGVIGIAALLV